MPCSVESDDTRALYDELWRDARAGFELGRFETDPLIDDPRDTRRGLSLILRLGPPALAGLVELGDALREVADEQYFHRASELHVTVLSVISCIDGFRIDEVEPGRYAELLAACVADIDPFVLTFEGITASPSCVMARGFAETDALRVLRARLRKAIAGAGLRHSMERRYTARTAHVTLMRLRCPPGRSAALVERLDALRGAPIGMCTIERVELVFNDWYHRRADVVDLAHVRLIRSHA